MSFDSDVSATVKPLRYDGELASDILAGSLECYAERETTMAEFQAYSMAPGEAIFRLVYRFPTSQYVYHIHVLGDRVTALCWEHSL